jgi:hypothetical protein
LSNTPVGWDSDGNVRGTTIGPERELDDDVAGELVCQRLQHCRQRSRGAWADDSRDSGGGGGARGALG